MAIADGESIPMAYKHPQKMHYLPQHNFIPKHISLQYAFSDFNVDFEEFADHFPNIRYYKTSKMNILSGGMCRVAEIYLIIKSPSQFVLLDEPFSQISPVMINKLKSIIEEERSRKGFIITDHLYRHVLNFCTKDIH